MPSRIHPPGGVIGSPADSLVSCGHGARAIEARWLGRVPYREAWDLQKRLAAARADGRIGDQLLLLEHPRGPDAGPPGGRGARAGARRLLAERGIEVLRVERGGEVTYHGPGQLVAYPIVRLADRELLLRPYVRALEAALADTCAATGSPPVAARATPAAGWTPNGPLPRKIGALGVRVERGVAYHGIALNVTVDLADFDLIDPCGMPGLRSTSIAASSVAATSRRRPTSVAGGRRASSPRARAPARGELRDSPAHADPARACCARAAGRRDPACRSGARR